MTKHIIHNKEITGAINELVKEAFSELGVKLADLLSAVEVEYMGYKNTKTASFSVTKENPTEVWPQLAITVQAVLVAVPTPMQVQVRRALSVKAMQVAKA